MARNFKKLIETGESLLTQHSSDEKLLYLVGIAYDQFALQIGNDKEKKKFQICAMRYFRKMLAMDGHSAQANRGLGLVALHQNKFRQALEYYKKAYAINPKDTSNFTSLGNTYRQMRKYSLALMWYKKCFSHKELRALAYVNLAGLYQDIKKDTIAKQYAKKAIGELSGKRDAYSIMLRHRMQELINQKPLKVKI